MKNLSLLLVLASTLLCGWSQFNFPISVDNPSAVVRIDGNRFSDGDNKHSTTEAVINLAEPSLQP